MANILVTGHNQVPTGDLTPITDISTASSSAHLRMFMGKVREVYPRCQFSYGSVGVPRSQLTSPSFWTTVYVYHDWKPLTMGQIGYGNFRNEGGEETFMVHSPQISNGKYATYSDQYHMKMTKNWEVAVANTKKFLRDVSTKELAQHFEQNVRNQWSKTSSSLEADVRRAYDDMFDFHKNKDTVIRELENLVNTGWDHDWIDPQFSEKVNNLLHLNDEKMEAARERSSKIVMVSAENRPSGVCYELASTEDISVYRYDIEWKDKGRFTEETLQAKYPDIVGKLAMLQMCEVDQWVDGVGCKTTPTVHYVTA